MTNDVAPEYLRRFIRDNIDSVETLRVLLLLRSRRERDWTAEELSAELRSSPEAMRRRLEHAAARLLALRRGSTYRYSASGAGDAALVELAKLYRERRAAIINVIASALDD